MGSGGFSIKKKKKQVELEKNMDSIKRGFKNKQA